MRFWQRIVNAIRRIFTGIRETIDSHAATAVKVVQVVKYIVEHPGTDFLVALTKTDLDNQAVEWVRANIDGLILELSITAACAKKATPEERLACYIEQLRKLSEPVRNAVYAKLASRITKGLSPAEISEVQADLAVQIEYAINGKPRA